MDISIKTNELEPIRDQTDLIAELHQLRTQLERAMEKAERYDKLGAYLTKCRWFERTDTVQPSGYGFLKGPTFDEAVDALPERDA